MHDHDEPTGWAIVWPLVVWAACLACALAFTAWCFVRSYLAE